MVSVSNGVLLIALLSQLSLAEADEFSDGTAKYVEVDWVEAKPLDYRIRENSYEISSRFVFEIFLIKGEDNKCLYKVLKTSFIGMTNGEFLPHYLAKASCALTLFTMSDVLHFYIKYSYDQEFIEYRTKGNTCRVLHRQANKPDVITNNDCSEVPNLSKSAVFGPVENWENSREFPSYIPRGFYLRNYIMFDNTFKFLLYKYEDKNETQCWVNLDYLMPPDAYPHRINQFRMGCELDMTNLHRVVKQIRPDTLVLKFEDNKCFQATTEVYQKPSSPSRNLLRLSNSTFICDGLLNPVKDVKIEWN